ncbi:MAG: hypothetical protein JOZ57_12340 [Abitibacteriaceae bacterium]|nr:hypothetical protein [Abditibacteriaceae bacterium]
MRWTHNSLRLRISPSELAQLQQGEIVTETLMLSPDGSWSAIIQPDSALTNLILAAGTLRFLLAPSDLERLSVPETEGVYFTTASEPPVRYFIEKDFPCIHPRADGAQEPATETFAPPADFAQRKEGIEED